MKKLFAGLLFLFLPLSCFAYTKVGIIGDSISFPYPVAHWNCFHYYLAKDLDQEMGEPIRMINYSVSCTMTDTLMLRLKDMVKNDRPDIVLITLGINDCTQGRLYEDIIKNYKEAIQFLRNEHIPLMIGTIDPCIIRFPNRRSTYFTQFKAEIYDKLREENPDVVFFPFLTEELLDNPIYHSFDIIHVNEKGHRLIANEIKPFLLAFILDKREHNLLR
jgi:acyl-CoA thioesterase I